MDSVEERREKYSAHWVRPVKGRERKGRRRVAQVGPCSWMMGLEEKYFESSSSGGRGLMRAWQKSWAVVRSCFARSGDIARYVCERGVCVAGSELVNMPARWRQHR